MALNGKLYRKWGLRITILLVALVFLPLIVFAGPRGSRDQVPETVPIDRPAATTQIAKQTKSILDFENKPVALSAIAPFEINKDGDLDHCEALIASAIGSLPAEHSAPLEAVNLTSKKMGRRGYGGYGSIDLQCVNMDDTELVGVLIHEMGHIVDIDYLTGESLAASLFIDFDRYVPADDASVNFYSISWVDSETRRPGSDKFDFVSVYAMTDPFEDFAETYTMYVLHGGQFKKMAEKNSALAEKYNFMKYNVFFGREFKNDSIYMNSAVRVYDTTRVKFSLDKFFGV